MPAYDESILVQMSDRLYTRASRVLFYGSMLGALIGMVAGITLMAPSGEATAMLVGGVACAVFCALVGFILGMERAFMLRLQAQTILVQVQIERNTRAAAGLARSA